MKPVWLAGTALVLALATIPGAGQIKEPWVGIWVEDVSKSTYTGQVNRSAVVTLGSWKNGMSFINDVITADGQKQHIVWKARFDGRFYPVTGNPRADEMSLQRTGPRQVVQTNRLKGSVVNVAESEFSEDGKTWTQILKVPSEGSFVQRARFIRTRR